MDQQNERGNTPAHVAAAFGALNVLCFLNDHGARFDILNAKEHTPLDAACHIGEAEAAALLEALLAGKSGPDIEARESPFNVGKGKSLDSNDEATYASSYRPQPIKESERMSTVTALLATPAREATPAPEGTTHAKVKADPMALRWADVYEHGKGTEGARCNARGTLTVRAAPGLECWVIGIGEETLHAGGTCCAYRIAKSHRNMGDCMLLGVIDADATAQGVRASRIARALLYCPRAGELWYFNKGRVVERIEMPSWACLFGQAVGAEVRVRVNEDGRVAFRINGEPEFVSSVEMPSELRPCARLGKVGDTVALRRADSGSGETTAERGAERASNDSVITGTALPL